MMRIFSRSLSWRPVVVGALLALTLTACEKVTQANFDQIQTDMTETQVREILGDPNKTDSVDLGIVSGTNSVWKGKNGEISVQFVNGKVKMKDFTQK